ncbi:Squalene/phytoene synthase [Cristinia sonorae]|uniref:Squalene/phytoene synthase n=1 Tax=Cristinia sonorae TaxID=1940300 RepID=A0A8K0XTF8_9AGAR|nr:Squalene/phytoene synthase [Cristinia sonorae]
MLRPCLARSSLPKRHWSPRTRSLSSAHGHDAGLNDPTGYCKDLVRKRDHEAFLTAQFYPTDSRDAFYALRALYIELATVQESVSNAMIGKMRMQFWKDAMKGIADGSPPRHPIALALHQAYATAKFPSYHLKRIVEARDAELHSPTHLTTESLLAHAESTSSTFLYSLLSFLSLSSSHSLSHAASHLGVSQTIATLLRALPYHAAGGRMVIPAEITARHGVSQEEVFRKGGGAKGIDEAVFEFATLANDHLITAREMLKEHGGKVPERARPVFLSAIPTGLYLERLEKVNFDAFHPSLQVRTWRLPWRIWQGYYSGRI